LYQNRLGKIGGDQAHHLLHTHYNFRRRLKGKSMLIVDGKADNKIEIRVCVGTSCYLKGSHDILRRVAEYVKAKSLQDQVQVKATFCFEKCDKGPTVKIGDATIRYKNEEQLFGEIEKILHARIT